MLNLATTWTAHSFYSSKCCKTSKTYSRRLHILVALALNGSPNIVADIDDQVTQVADLFGRDNVFLSFGIGSSYEDGSGFRFLEISEVSLSANILHTIQFVHGVVEWTRKTLSEYMTDFKVAIILRGVICATDLVRLIIYALENGADMVSTTSASLNWRTNVNKAAAPSAKVLADTSLERS